MKFNIYGMSRAVVCTVEFTVRAHTLIARIACKVKVANLLEELVLVEFTALYGVGEASKYYFGKSVSDLTLAEASMLVGMFQNPYLYNPYKNPNNNKERRKIRILSDDETWGLVLTEAMMIGVPCITSDFKVAFEQIKDQNNGIILSNDENEPIFFICLNCVK